MVSIDIAYGVLSDCCSSEKEQRGRREEGEGMFRKGIDLSEELRYLNDHKIVMGVDRLCVRYRIGNNRGNYTADFALNI